MNLDELESIRCKIEKMQTFHQIEVLKIFNEHKEEIVLNENSNGVFINLTDLSINILNKLIDYIEYYNQQEKSINYFEDKQYEFKSTFFEKNIKEKTTDNVKNEHEQQTQITMFN
tara:strand:- start:92 stop:436 length:345 start_codon:yes stop_codon:yes gene_type:complete